MTEFDKPIERPSKLQLHKIKSSVLETTSSQAPFKSIPSIDNDIDEFQGNHQNSVDSFESSSLNTSEISLEGIQHYNI